MALSTSVAKTHSKTQLSQVNVQRNMATRHHTHTLHHTPQLARRRVRPARTDDDVADAYNCRILFVRHRRIVRQIGETHVCVHNPPATLGSVNGDTPMPGGGVLVSEINGAWIDAFSKTGKLLWDFQAPVAYPSDRSRSRAAGSSSPTTRAGRGADREPARTHPVALRADVGVGGARPPVARDHAPNGDIAVNDDYNDRVVIIDPQEARIVWQYGHDYQPGDAAGYLHTPEGWTTSRSARTRSRSGSSSITRRAHEHMFV